VVGDGRLREREREREEDLLDDLRLQNAGWRVLVPRAAFIDPPDLIGPPDLGDTGSGTHIRLGVSKRTLGRIGAESRTSDAHRTDELSGSSRRCLWSKKTTAVGQSGEAQQSRVPVS
jgi:hypothetical protein